MFILSQARTPSSRSKEGILLNCISCMWNVETPMLDYNPPISDDDLNNEPYDDQFKYDGAQYTNMMLNYPNKSTHEVASKDRNGLAG